MTGAPVQRALPGGALGLVAVAGIALVGAAVLFLFAPESSALYPPCPFHLLTGLHCPGCGSLRAVHHLTHGRLGVALDYNPLLVLSLPLLGYGWAAALWTRFGGRRLPAVPTGPCAVRAYLGLLLAFWVLRNLPWPPFTVLAP